MKQYEIANHLGNVRVTFTDVKNYDPLALSYSASLSSVNNYYAFGGLQTPRTKGAESYKFGFNGQEMDNEIKGDGNSIEYKYRVHDPRLGRFLSIDPLSAKYPWNSPYAFCENRVIDGVELEGLEHVFYLLLYNKEKGLLEVQRFDELDATMNTVLGDFAPIQGNQAFVYGSDSHWHLIPEPLRKYSINNYSDDIDKNLEFVNSFPIADEAWDAKVKAEALVRIGNIANAGLGAGLLIAGASQIYKAISAWTATKKGIQLTKKVFGHTFTTHGDDMTNFLIKRAEGSGMAQGQFLNNQKAAKFILDNIGKTAKGTVDIPIPKNFPARIVMPDGTFKAATHIRLVPGGGGVKTAYPLIL